MSLRPSLRAALLLTAVLPGCVSFQVGRGRLDQPPSEGAVEQLVPGQSTLAQCLEVLGAPTTVERTETGEQMTLAWTWNKTASWGIGVSVPVKNANAQFNYDDADEELPRLQLRFDGTGTLRAMELPGQELPPEVGTVAAQAD